MEYTEEFKRFLKENSEATDIKQDINNANLFIDEGGNLDLDLKWAEFVEITSCNYTCNICSYVVADNGWDSQSKSMDELLIEHMLEEFEKSKIPKKD